MGFRGARQSLAVVSSECAVSVHGSQTPEVSRHRMVLGGSGPDSLVRLDRNSVGFSSTLPCACLGAGTGGPAGGVGLGDAGGVGEWLWHRVGAISATQQLGCGAEPRAD